MQGSALYNPRAHATPSQLRESAQHRARLERIADLAKPDDGIVCHPASVCTPLAPPIVPVVAVRSGADAPVVADYAGMWFYDLVFGTAARESEILAPYYARQPRIDEIQIACGKHYGVKVMDILSARRTACVVRPRQIAMYLARTLTMKSLPDIGLRFGGRDHTTVIHAVRKIDALTAKDPVLFGEVETLKRQILEGIA